jgi:hypothetical protein
MGHAVTQAHTATSGTSLTAPTPLVSQLGRASGAPSGVPAGRVNRVPAFAAVPPAPSGLDSPAPNAGGRPANPHEQRDASVRGEEMVSSVTRPRYRDHRHHERRRDTPDERVATPGMRDERDSNERGGAALPWGGMTTGAPLRALDSCRSHARARPKTARLPSCSHERRSCSHSPNCTDHKHARQQGFP